MRKILSMMLALTLAISFALSSVETITARAANPTAWGVKYSGISGDYLVFSISTKNDSENEGAELEFGGTVFTVLTNKGNNQSLYYLTGRTAMKNKYAFDVRYPISEVVDTIGGDGDFSFTVYVVNSSLSADAAWKSVKADSSARKISINLTLSGLGTSSDDDDDDENYEREESSKIETSDGNTIVSNVATYNPTATHIAVTDSFADVKRAAGIPSNKTVDMQVDTMVGPKAKEAIDVTASSLGVKVANYMEITMFEAEQNGARNDRISNLSSNVEFVFSVPADVDAKTNDFAVMRITDGRVTIIPDTDNDPKTITIKNDRSSGFAIVYGPKGSFK